MITLSLSGTLFIFCLEINTRKTFESHREQFHQLSEISERNSPSTGQLPTHPSSAVHYNYPVGVRYQLWWDAVLWRKPFTPVALSDSSWYFTKQPSSKQAGCNNFLEWLWETWLLKCVPACQGFIAWFEWPGWVGYNRWTKQWSHFISKLQWYMFVQILLTALSKCAELLGK